MSSTTPAGWYPDPEREGATRWWDGAQWAPSQEPASDDDRFKPKDESDAGGATTSAGSDDAQSAEPSWSPEPYAGAGSAWDGTPSPAPASAPQATGSTPSWQQQETPSWQQQSTPAWGEQDGTPAHGAPQDFSQTGAQQWNSYGTAPKKNRTGLFVTIGIIAVVGLVVLVGGGIWAFTTFINANQQTQTQGGGGTSGGTTTAGDTFEVTVAPNGQSFTDIEITTAGNYQIDVISTNSEDPRIELSGNGQTWSDDDGGDEPLASRLNEYLEPGTYTLMVEEYSGDPLVAQVSVQQY